MNIVDNPNNDSLKPFGRYLDLCKESGTDGAGRSDDVEEVPVVSLDDTWHLLRRFQRRRVIIHHSVAVSSDVRSDVYCDCVHLTIAACSDAALIIETYMNQSFIYTLKDCK